MHRDEGDSEPQRLQLSRKEIWIEIHINTWSDPEGEPSASDIAEAVEEINEDGITVLFIEEYTSVSAVDRIVELTVTETMPNGIGVEYLYTMEMSPKDSSDDYISLMRKSLQSLSDGLGC